MPLEIRELVIKVTIDEQAPKAAVNGISSKELQALKEKIVRECMDNLTANREFLSTR
ncbi:DUF5908 family protein [Chitinophaga agrisoli]|uniref:DUF5908 family protein n=1 Tax=Chitinophaga agrisoli TaxID=2607653 RepID=UPI001661D0E0|nr:DUF5908 family protein [Chitinophaga agrisoli]